VTLSWLTKSTNVRSWIAWLTSPFGPTGWESDLEFDAEALCAELLHREARR
jgi:hypothetical protein